MILFDNLTEQDACILEKIFISIFNTTDKNMGYNKDSGGKHPTYLNDEARKKLSEVAKKRIEKKYKRIGYHVSEYNKQRIRETHNIAVMQFTKNMLFVKEYESLTVCEKETGIHASNISAVCNKKQKTAGGFIWMRKSDYKSQAQAKVD